MLPRSSIGEDKPRDCSPSILCRSARGSFSSWRSLASLIEQMASGHGGSPWSIDDKRVSSVWATFDLDRCRDSLVDDGTVHDLLEDVVPSAPQSPNLLEREVPSAVHRLVNRLVRRLALVLSIVLASCAGDCSCVLLVSCRRTFPLASNRYLRSKGDTYCAPSTISSYCCAQGSTARECKGSGTMVRKFHKLTRKSASPRY
eukprot:6693480-Prymnesium_polylepis.1